MQGLAVSPAAARTIDELFDERQGRAQKTNPEFDAEASEFWSSFLDERKVAHPIGSAIGRPQRGGESSDNEAQPIFLHYGPGGFKNAAELDAADLISEGDVSVSLNTSTIKIAQRDLEKFQHLQNAQIRVDVAQKTPILPVIEALAYTVVSGTLYVKVSSKSTSSSASKPATTTKPTTVTASTMASAAGHVQTIAVDSDAAWQKMQNIILPGGEGRWALNLEAQKKDSLLFRLLQKSVKGAGQFVPMVSMPGIALSALQSFNVLYGVMHSKPVSVIKSNPLRVFATQEAVQKTGAPGAATGILLKSGTYVLIPANQAENLEELKDLTVIQGRLVPPKTPVNELDSVAAETLKQVTYVTFDVETKPARLFPGSGPLKSG
jgi:hypothetical protein